MSSDWRRRYTWWYFKDLLRECEDYKDRIANADVYAKKDREELDGEES